MKKGTKVWRFFSWDDKGKFTAELLTLTSLGEKQGTAVRDVNGKNIEYRLYAPYNYIFPADEITDLNAFGIKLAQQWLDDQIEFLNVHRLQFIDKCLQEDRRCAYDRNTIVDEINKFNNYQPSFFLK